MTSQVPQFVNLNKTRTHVPGPDGQQVLVLPFEESFEESTRRADAVYVVQGEWWAQFVGDNGPLFRFPAPREYGRESFPALDGRNVRAVVPRRVGSVAPDSESDEVDAGGARVGVTAGLGRPRVTGDVITPDGFIRRTNPRTGAEELVEDIAENRLTVHSKTVAERARSGEAVPSEDPNAQLKRSIVDELEALGVESYRQFADLSDEVLLRIPGLNQHNLPLLRKNIGDLLKRMDEQRREEGGETPLGESADGRTHGDLGLDDSEPDLDVDAEHEADALARIEAKQKAPTAAKRKAKRKAGTKGRAVTKRKASKRKPATD